MTVFMVQDQEEAVEVPEAVAAVFTHFLTCEMTTIGKSGRPITWPVMPIYWPQQGQFVVLTSIGLPQKAFNVRQNPRVALLFSDPTGSDLADPPIVLVQGEAQAADQVVSAFSGMEPPLLALVKEQAAKMIERQPAMKLYTNNPLSRYLMDWYFMRLIITIAPRRIQWWANGDSPRQPAMAEVADVA